MKIMLQNHTFYPILGGIENYLYHVSKTLKEMGHQPIILCEKHEPQLSDFEIFDGIKIIRHPYYHIPRRMLFMKPRMVSEHLKYFISKHVGGIDLIISRYPHYGFASCSLNLNIPIFYIPATVAGNYIKNSSENSNFKAKFFNVIWRPILDHMESKSISMSNKVITLSRFISDSLAQYYSFNPKRFIINPPGVDLDRFRKSDGSKGIRQEFNIPNNRVVVLYVGRLSLEKNVEKLIKDFSKLRGKNVHLLIVGYGPERLRLEQLRNDLNMIDKILFVGPRTDVERFYSAADIFVLPSKYEAFGQVVLEAMAAGLPCIAFKRAFPEYQVASEEIIRNGVTGFCVDPYNKHDLLDRLLYLIESRDLRKKMGLAGRRYCESRFTWEGHVKRLLDLINT
jgi:glycosyltransferase involved in cell wall biosynthesis